MDNEKEISFGAFDSELMRQEIYIPEGFEATIDGDKIILKKIESEDEKVRKALIEMVHDTIPAEFEKCNTTKVDCLVWLRKQGQKLTDDEMTQVLRTEYEKGRADAFVQMQKSWSEDDEEILTEIITDVKFAQERNSQTQMNQIIFEEETNWLNSLKKRYTWTPSDEQIRALEYIINNAHNTSYSCKIAKELLEQLKKLKGE